MIAAWKRRCSDQRRGAPPHPGQVPLSRLGRGHRLPRAPRPGPHAGALAHPGFGLGARASEPFSDRADRHRQELSRLRPGREGLSGWVHRPLHTRQPTVPGPSARSRLARLARVDVLLVDDWAMVPLADTERRDFLEICEDRYPMRSMILTSQLPVAQWHEQIGDPTLADSILDRLVHNAHRIEMRGESMRKKRGGKEA